MVEEGFLWLYVGRDVFFILHESGSSAGQHILTTLYCCENSSKLYRRVRKRDNDHILKWSSFWKNFVWEILEQIFVIESQTHAYLQSRGFKNNQISLLTIYIRSLCLGQGTTRVGLTQGVSEIIFIYIYIYRWRRKALKSGGGGGGGSPWLKKTSGLLFRKPRLERRQGFYCHAVRTRTFAVSIETGRFQQWLEREMGPPWRVDPMSVRSYHGAISRSWSPTRSHYF